MYTSKTLAAATLAPIGVVPQARTDINHNTTALALAQFLLEQFS